MDLNKLMEINEETKEILTESYQPILIGVKQEQWNAMVRHMTTVGAAIAENTALIAKLPTQDGIDKLIRLEVRRHNTEMEKNTQYQTRKLVELINAKLTDTGKDIRKIVAGLNGNMMKRLEMRDLSTVKYKLKWALIGAILPGMLLLWQLLSNL